MNYRHAFHAGSFADVFKHALLARVLVHLGLKAAPFRLIDTHAGIGRYDLSGGEAARTGEWRDGIGRLGNADIPPAVQALLAPYLDAVGPRDGGRPAFYPGSPVLAQALLRPADRLIACELHPVDAAALKTNLGRDRRVRVIELDGYTGLKAFVPPPERRGGVLVDPPFETRDEFDRMAGGFAEAYRKWPTGTYMLWYPLKDRGAVKAFADALTRAGPSQVLQLHLVADPAALTPVGPLGGCGMAVINPPYTLEGEAKILLPFLAAVLGRGGAGEWSCRSLGAATASPEPDRTRSSKADRRQPTALRPSPKRTDRA